MRQPDRRRVGLSCGLAFGWVSLTARANELAPLGPIRANLITGVLWGLPHAPLILMGFNCEPHRVLGIFAMCGLTTSLSSLLGRAREFTGSMLAPAIPHGAFNGSQGFFVPLDREPAENLSAEGGTIPPARRAPCTPATTGQE
jgi:hypothetical protein